MRARLKCHTVPDAQITVKSPFVHGGWMQRMRTVSGSAPQTAPKPLIMPRVHVILGRLTH